MGERHRFLAPRPAGLSDRPGCRCKARRTTAVPSARPEAVATLGVYVSARTGTARRALVVYVRWYREWCIAGRGSCEPFHRRYRPAPGSQDDGEGPQNKALDDEPVTEGSTVREVV